MLWKVVLLRGKKYLAWDLVYLHESWSLLLCVIKKKHAVQIWKVSTLIFVSPCLSFSLLNSSCMIMRSCVM